MANPEKKGQVFNFSNEQKPLTAIEAAMAHKANRGKWRSVETAFSVLSVNEACEALERLSPELDDVDKRRLRAAFVKGITKVINKPSEDIINGRGR